MDHQSEHFYLDDVMMFIKRVDQGQGKRYSVFKFM